MMNIYNFVNNTGVLANDLSDAAVNGYLYQLTLKDPWGAYKEWNHSPFTCGPSGGRFHNPSELGLYAGSGQACCGLECRGNLSGKLWVPTGPIVLDAFDLRMFASDYGYEELFTQPGCDGGYGPTRFAKDWLHQHHNTSGIIYQSAQMNQRGGFGLCFALLPYPGQLVQPPFYIPPSTPFATTAGGIVVPTSLFYP